jgi:hypothetical protein
MRIRIASLFLVLGVACVTPAQQLTVTAISHSTQEKNYTTNTPVQSSTNCNGLNSSVNCNTTTYGGGSQIHAVYRFTQLVSASQDGKVTWYTLSRTARWPWSAMDWLTDGESFLAEIKGKHMFITCRKSVNQEKTETLKYDVLDIRPAP